MALELSMSGYEGVGQARAANQALVRLAQHGDLPAFEEVVHRFQRRVFGLAYQYLQDRDEAQDLAQEIFVRLYRQLQRYDPSRPFEPWFWKLAGNVAATYLRRRPAPAQELEDSGMSSAATDELDLQLAISDLTPELRLPLLLHYQADLRVEDVAAALGLSAAAVKSRLYRARAVLRVLLAEDCQA
ncbi:MAG: sigma-70 family RNA polymerase sigma factor [Candidatus Dormibacteraeota bacterium]|nr:sigma-70 family RNA polymerase sigma factor [Candidatus Dormibacteraeota bacterium]